MVQKRSVTMPTRKQSAQGLERWGKPPVQPSLNPGDYNRSRVPEVVELLKGGMKPVDVGHQLGLTQNWVVYYARLGGIELLKKKGCQRCAEVHEKTLQREHRIMREITSKERNGTTPCTCRKCTIQEAIVAGVTHPWTGKVQMIPKEEATTEVIELLRSHGLDDVEIASLIERRKKRRPPDSA